MEGNRKRKCLLCLSYLKSCKSLQWDNEQLLEIVKQNLLSCIEVSSETTKEYNNLKHQLPVTFLLRRLLHIPTDVNTKFTQDYGNPCSWVFCCNSCSVIIDEAGNIFHQIVNLQNQLKSIQTQIKNTIVLSTKSRKSCHDLKEGTDAVRKYFTSEYCNSEDLLPVEVKLEYVNPEDNVSEINNIIKSTNYPSCHENGQSAAGNKDCHNRETSSSHKGIEIEANQDYQVIHPPTKNKTEFAKGKDERGRDINHPDRSDKDFSAPSIKLENSSIETVVNKFVCYSDKCGKKFMKVDDLMQHVKCHKGLTAHQCHFCGKDFSTSTTLKLHIRTHTGDRPFKCKLCEKSFTQSCNLKSHEMRHTGDKSHECEYCGKGFSSASDLRSHKRLHSGKRPYSCKVCKKTFINSSNLKVHQVTHTGIKPHKCNICGKSFTQAGSLKSHLEKHTKNSRQMT